MSQQAVPVDDSCGGEHAGRALTVEQAQEFILSQCAPIRGSEKLAVRAALDRVLSEDVISPVDVPSHTNSAMDGYAVRAGDLPAEDPVMLRVIGTTLAGHSFDGTVNAGECVRVMTGSVIPAGADTVLMQERVERAGDSIRVRPGHRAGENVRLAGEDLKRGQAILTAGTRIHPPELGLLASIGRAEVVVRRRPRVAFFSTGDELCSVGEALSAGQIYDSNRYTLYGMLQRAGVDAVDMGVVRDRPDAIEQAFADASANADVVITSGGVSVGEADYVKETLQKIGQVGFWQIAMKPGRPLAFGHVNDVLFFGLPGNPVSVMVTFYQFVAPALRRLMGEPVTADATTVRACTASALRKRPGRTEYQRAVLERGPDGELRVRSTGSQGSGVLNSMSRANCFIVLPRDGGDVEAGAWVDVQPFFGIM